METGLVKIVGREGIDDGGELYCAMRHVGLLLAHVLRSVHYICLDFFFFAFMKMVHDLSQTNFNRSLYYLKRLTIIINII